jgi:hypothetical protein
VWRRTEGWRWRLRPFVAVEFEAGVLPRVNKPRRAAGDQTARNRVRSVDSASAGDSRESDVRAVTGRVIPASERRPIDSSSASVEESAAAEQQHHEDDEEQCVRVHFLSRVFGECGPASLPTER